MWCSAPSATSKSQSLPTWTSRASTWNASAQQNEPLQQFCKIQDHSDADLLSIGWSYALEVASGKQSSLGADERAEIVQGTRGASMSVRCGIGYDLHRLAPGRKLIVGGIELPFEKGPVGHSDGDVLAHALCDALLGAAGLGDIGTHFPDTDPKWKGANSLLFLEHAKKLLDGKGFAIEWIDAVVITEKPKLGPHFPTMREALAGALRVSVDHVHLKAKTNEGVDAIGRGEAIAAYVVVTLSSD
jgi:2-C-methyl-D-erythritol 2,4-cyclodiphosphate synthase